MSLRQSSRPTPVPPNDRNRSLPDVECILCGRLGLAFFYQDKRRPYGRCDVCGLVQVPPQYWLSAEAEKAIYDQHDNQVTDPGYQRFLRPAFNAVQAHVPAPALGLDFGCGPGPALARMLSQAGYAMEVYDHFYYPDRNVLAKTYAFITATEVVEHLHDPAHWLNRMWDRIRPGGALVVQTKRVLAPEHFVGWHYIRDPTHVAFFSLTTFQWLSRQWHSPVRVTGPDVVVFQKRD